MSVSERPFLSIVVPCYNSRRYLPRLLKSISECDCSLEVILADDCSTESYQDIVDAFSGKLQIRQCCNSYNCGSPSNSREFGAMLSVGKYLTFVDHDDMIIPEGIHKIEELVKESEPEYIVAGIRQLTPEGDTLVEKFGILPFLHGKFFNVDRFYKKCNLHHQKDMKHSEDNYFTALIACNLIKYNIEPVFTDFCTYAWSSNNESLGTSFQEKERTDLSVNIAMLKDNISITEEVMFKFFDEGSLPIEVAREWLVREIISMYFTSQLHFQFFEQRKPFLQTMVKGIKERLHFSNEDILEFTFQDNERLFRDELNNFLQFHPEGCIPHLRVEEYLEELSQTA